MSFIFISDSKSNEREPYKLTKIYKYSFNIIDDEINLINDDPDNYSLKDIINVLIELKK